MKILVLTHNYPRSPEDPAGAFVARLARDVAAAGHEVRVLAPHAPGLPTADRDGAVRLQRFRYAPDTLERVAYTGDMQRFARFPGVFLLAAFLWRFRNAATAMARAWRPDVVHAHWWFPGGWVARACGAPYVVTCHGTDVRLLEGGAWRRRIAGRVLGGAVAVTTVSAFLARDLARLLGPAAPPATVTRMPVPPEPFARGLRVPKARPPRVLYVGNLNPAKGVDLLVQAARRLRDRGIVCAVRIVGDGPARGELERLAETLGVTGMIDFAGRRPLGEMPDEYGAATVTVLPTRGRAEGLGLSLVEALLSGSAVIGTPAGGIPEVVIPGETGLIARDGDPDDLATQIARLLTDPSVRERTAQVGREQVRTAFAPERAVQAFLEIYERGARRPAG